MGFYRVTYFALFAGLITITAGLQAARPVSPGPFGTSTPLLGGRFPLRKCAEPRLGNRCTSNSQCCENEVCFGCPTCGPNERKTCFPKNGPFPPCALPDCSAICQRSTCSSDEDCCFGQKCLTCPTCIGGKSGSNTGTSGKCVNFQEVNLSKPLCPLPPLPRCEPGKCTKRGDCRKNEFCFRCARCEGRNGPEFDSPGRCLSLDGPIPGCPAPQPCDGLLLKPALTAEQP